MLAVVLTILAKFTVIFKLGLRNISRKITSFIFLTTTISYYSLSFKIIDKANSKFDSKVKETLHINWKKPYLNAQQNNASLTVSL